MTSSDATYTPATFDDVPGWADDDHAAAFRAFRKSAAKLKQRAASPSAPGPATPRELLELCDQALLSSANGEDVGSARAFFEARFTPHRVSHGERQGLLTGYYEPRIPGARQPDDRFRVPIYARPPDLVNLVDETERGAKSGGLTHARRTAAGHEPYFTRAEIERGALDGQGLDLFHFDDLVDVFFMQVQGSGLVALADGAEVRVTYDGKNGFPYTSIGRYVIDAGLMPRDDVSLDGLKSWLRANPEIGREVMWKNESYIFFRELLGEEGKAPMGSFEIPLSTGRSLAVDTRYHAIGLPVFVTAETLTHATGAQGFHRLMIAQDVGSAIVGPERGDIYFGSGDRAYELASVTLHPGNFFVLLPKTP